MVVPICLLPVQHSPFNFWGNIVTGAFGLLGTALGALLVFFSTRRTQHDQWLRDERLSEFRELLSIISDITMIRVTGSGQPIPPEDARRAVDAEEKAMRTIRDRILIADDLARDQILEIWTAACRQFDEIGLFWPFGTNTTASIRLSLRLPKGPLNNLRLRSEVVRIGLLLLGVRCDFVDVKTHPSAPSDSSPL